MQDLVSCLCISKNKPDLVSNSIKSFLAQTYPNKELVFIYEDNNPYIQEIKNLFSDKSIKYYEIKHNPNIKLGSLRNISLEKALGKYIIQWDDDDIYHANRIMVQYTYLTTHNARAVMLDQRYILMHNTLYLSNVWPFEGSIMTEKSLLFDMYLNKSRGEDTNILITLLEQNLVDFIQCPYLYIYKFHGENVFNEEHFKNIISASTKIMTIKNINRFDKLHKILQTLRKKCMPSELNNKKTQLYNFLVKLVAKNNKKFFILNTYGMNNPDEGLSVVYHSIKSLGDTINDSRHLSNKIIFVAGICSMYYKLLSPKNINIIYTTYEFYPLPNIWVNVLNNYYHIILVPHDKIKKMFIDSGINKPIYVVQQNFPKRNFICDKKNSTKFTIGFLGIPAKRKNLELLIDAIEIVKLEIPNVVLKVHISKYYTNLTPIKFQKNKYFDVTYGFKTDEEIDKWYSSLDAYIFPSSGEGWSFTPRESLSLKIPTIISDCLVHKDLESYSKMISLPITVEKIAESIIETYKNIDIYKQKAITGSLYVTKNNKNSDMLSSIKKIISKIN